MLVHLNMPAGELTLGDHTRECMEGEFRYTRERYRPVIKSMQQEDELQLQVRMGESLSNLEFKDPDRNEWDIHLPQDIPMSLELKVGAGKADVDLSGFALKYLKMTLGAGEFDVDLGRSSLEGMVIHAGVGDLRLDLGDRPSGDLLADITCGIGEITLIFPEDAGIFVHTEGILGEVSAPSFRRSGKNYYNDHLGISDDTIRIKITGGIGKVNLRMQ